MIRIILFLVISVISVNSMAWNAVGHQVIATIAYDKLNPKAQKNIDKMVKDFHKEYSTVTTFVEMASWADSLRSQNIEIFAHWHYIDTPFSTDGTSLSNIIDTDNIVYALNNMFTIMHSATINPYEKARFLAFLEHCVEDIHQPLHTTSRISKKYPLGDAGGNLYYIHYPTEKNTTTLHKMWDDSFELLNVSSAYDISSLAETITSLYPESFFGAKVNDLQFEDWANEGFLLAKTIAYQTREYQVPTPEYIALVKQTVEEQLALAGYRLANLLNELFGSE